MAHRSTPDNSKNMEALMKALASLSDSERSEALKVLKLETEDRKQVESKVKSVHVRSCM